MSGSTQARRHLFCCSETKKKKTNNNQKDKNGRPAAQKEEESNQSSQFIRYYLLHNCPNVKYYKTKNKVEGISFSFLPVCSIPNSFVTLLILFHVCTREEHTHRHITKQTAGNARRFGFFFCLPNLFVSRGKISGPGSQ